MAKLSVLFGSILLVANLSLGERGQGEEQSLLEAYREGGVEACQGYLENLEDGEYIEIWSLLDSWLTLRFSGDLSKLDEAASVRKICFEVVNAVDQKLNSTLWSCLFLNCAAWTEEDWKRRGAAIEDLASASLLEAMHRDNEAIELASKSVKLASQLGDYVLQMDALNTAAFCAYGLEDYGRAILYASQSLHLAQSLGSQWAQYDVASILRDSLYKREEYDAALVVADRVLSVGPPSGHIFADALRAVDVERRAGIEKKLAASEDQ